MHGLSLDALSANSMVSANDLRNLNAALRSNGQSVTKANVGYPTQGQAATNDLAALVPQSIQATLDSATFMQQHIRFWNRLSKVDVSSTLHESNVVKQHGEMGLDPWVSEGGGGSAYPNSEGSYERKIVKIKYMAEKIELSDVATMVGITGVNRSALAQRTQDGTMALMGKLERSLFWADSDLQPLAFDGLDKQLAAGAPNNVTDNKGAATSPQQLQEVLGALLATPNYSMPNVIMCDPQVYQTLVNIATASGRHDMLSVTASGGGRSLVYGASELSVSGPAGTVPIISVPLLEREQEPNSGAVGPNDLATPTLSSVVGNNSSAVSPYKAGEVYKYKVVGVSEKGLTAPVESANVTIAADGNCAAFDIDHSAHANIAYYRIFRTVSAGGSKYGFLEEIARDAAATSYVDDGSDLPGTGTIFAGQMDPSVLYWAQLLDFTRRPLAQVQTTIPFLLMLFGSLHVKVPTKWWRVRNVAKSI